MIVRRVSIGVGVVIVALLALNVVGFLRYPGGPLKEDPDGSVLGLDLPFGDQGRNEVGMTSAADIKPYTPLYVGVFLRPGINVSATVEDMRLVDASSGIVLVDSLIGQPGKHVAGIGALQGDVGDQLDGYVQLPGTLVADSSGPSQPMVAVTVATRPGEQSYSGVAVDYRVGPFTFTTTYGPAVTVCVQPMREGVTCSADDSEGDASN